MNANKPRCMLISSLPLPLFWARQGSLSLAVGLSRTVSYVFNIFLINKNTKFFSRFVTTSFFLTYTGRFTNYVP